MEFALPFHGQIPVEQRWIRITNKMDGGRFVVRGYTLEVILCLNISYDDITY